MSAPAGRAGEIARDTGGRVLRKIQQAVGGGASPVEDTDPRSRWLKVTVNRAPDEVLPGGQLPAPLEALGTSVETEVRPAPGDKGTELAARPRVPGQPDLRKRVRSALGEAKQLIEVGEVLRVDPVPHGHRPATPTGKVVDAATHRADEEGLL